MLKFSLTIALLFASVYFLSAQQTITISGTSFKDANVYRNTRPGQENIANTNFGSHPRLSAIAWTNSSYQVGWRSLLYFNLNSIPAKSTIQSASLYLYSDPSFSSPSSAEGNSQLSGSNAIYLEKITQEWDENSVTWNNQPATTTAGRVWVGPSSSPVENLQINLSTTIQEWINAPITNNGLKMILENELYYRSRNYASSNHTNTSLRPKLVITYTPPVTEAACETPDLTEAELMSLPWYGNETFLQTYYDSLVQRYGNPSNARVAGHIESAWLKIPVKFWVYQLGSGNPGGNNPGSFPNEQRFQLMIDALNTAARNNGINFRFYMQTPSFVSMESALDVSSFTEQKSLATNYLDPQAINIHIVDRGTGGVFNPIHNAIFMPRTRTTTEGGASTVPHEVGHLFGLLHTHHTAGTICMREPVTRGRIITACPNGTGYTKRCNWTGDLLCDTDADPNMSEHGIYDIATCTWNANGTRDFRGDIYHPDQLNYMAYGNREARSCRSHFSNSQKQVMNFFAFRTQFKTSWLPATANQFDRHEPDDADIAARPINLGDVRTHTFHTSGRVDNVDWLRFRYPGSINNYQFIVTQTTTGAVGTVEIFVRNPNGTAADRVGGVTSTTTGNVTTYTIPCSSMTIDQEYLIRIPRNQSGFKEYDAELRANTATLTITGPDVLCSSATYTVANYSGSIIWSSSSSGISINSSGVATRVGSFVGEVQIRAQIAAPCGSTTLVKTVRTGVSYLTGTYYDNSTKQLFSANQVMGNVYVSARITDPAYTGGTWVYDSGEPTSWSQGGGTLNFMVPPGKQATFRMNANTTCGPTSQIHTFYALYTGMTAFSISPNPADNSIDVVDESENLLKGDNFEKISIENEESFQFKLYNDFSLIESGTSKGKKAIIDTKNFPTGIYYLHIIKRADIVKHKVIISH